MQCQLQHLNMSKHLFQKVMRTFESAPQKNPSLSLLPLKNNSSYFVKLTRRRLLFTSDHVMEGQPNLLSLLVFRGRGVSGCSLWSEARSKGFPGKGVERCAVRLGSVSYDPNTAGS